MEYGTACLAIEIHRKLKFPVTKRFAVLSWKVQAIFGATVSKPQHEMARIGSVRVKQCMRGGVVFRDFTSLSLMKENRRNRGTLRVHANWNVMRGEQ
jgi:hypothetical protein